MLHVGLDLSRKRLDFDLLCEDGSRLENGAVPPDADGLRGLARRVNVFDEPVCAAIESMNGARFVHDRLEELGWQVEIADAQKAKGLAPLACKTDKIDAWVLAELSRRELVPAIWLPSFERPSRARARPLALVPGAQALVAEAPRPRPAAGLRPHLPRHRPVRALRPATARAPSVPRALALRSARGDRHDR